MAFSYQFGNVTTANGIWLDANFQAAGLLGIIPCTVSGINALVLTPYTTPVIPTPVFTLQPNVKVSGIFVATNTGAATAAVGSTGTFPIYKDTPSGPAVLTGGELFLGNAFVLTFDQSLNAGGGGWHVTTGPTSSAGTVTSVGSGTGLTGGPITGSGTLALASIADQRLLANISGGAAAPSANSVTALLDYVFGNPSAQGSILNRGASTWAASSESAYTPALAFGGGSTGLTYATQVGQTFAIGYLTFAMVNITLTAKGSSTGSATLSLPSTAGGTSRVGGGLIVNYANLTSVTTIPWLSIAAGATTANLLEAGSATTSNLSDANFANNTSLQAIMLYLTG